MFDGLSTELMGAAVYDLGKGIIGSVSKTEWVQATLKKWKLSGEQHDFAARYLETLVEFSMHDKPVETLNLFRSDDIRRTFFDFYYGTHDRRGSKVAQQHSLDQSIAALRVGDDIKAIGVDVEVEAAFFWTIFRQKVQESRTVKEAEIDIKLQQLQRSMDDVNQMLSGFKLWMQENGKTEIQVDGTIYNIDKIDNGFFNDLITKSHQSSSQIPTKITRHKPVKWITDRPYVGRAKDVERLKSFFEHPQKPFFFLYGVGGIGKSHLLQVIDGILKTKPAYFRLNESTKLSSLIRDLGYGDVDSLSPSQQHDYFLKKTAEEEQALVFDDLYELPEDDILFRTILELSNQPTGKFLVISRALPLSVEIKEERRLGLNELLKDDFEEHLKDYHKAAHYDFELSSYLINACFKICKGYPLGGEFLLKLRHVSGEDFSEDIDSIGEIDPKNDTSHRDFMEHLLNSIFKRGNDKERELAKQMAVFMDPMPIKVFAELPAFDADTFHALTERKKIFYALKGKVFGVHALVRKILETRNGISYIAHRFAAEYYERMSQTNNGLDFESLFKAHFHFDRSKGGGEEAYLNGFLGRWTPEYGELSVKEHLRNKDTQVLDKFRFKLLIKQDDESKLDVGRVLRHSGNLSEAISLLKSLAESGYFRANVELGIAYRKSGNFAEAIEVLKKAVELGELAAMNELGITYREAKRLPEAIEVLKKAVDAGSVHSMNVLGITYRKAKRLSEAIEVLKKAAELEPTNFMVINELGITYREAKLLPEAIEVLKKAAEAGHLHAMNELGITYREAKLLPEAIEVLKKAVEVGHLYSMNELGITYREAKRLPEAIEVLKKAAELEPNNFIVYNELGITYREAKRLPEAIEVLKKLAELQPSNFFVLYALGNIYREAKQLPKAIEILKKLVNNGHVHSMNALGILYREAKRLPEAIEVLEKAVELGEVPAMNELGIAYREANLFEEAIEVLKKAVETGDLISMNELGITYREAKRLPEAIEVLERAVELGEVPAMNELGIAYRDANRFEDAIEILKLAVETGNIQSFNELGITYYKAKRMDEAIEVLEKAVELGHVPAMNVLGDIFREANRIDEAIEVLNKGLNKGSTSTYIKYTLLKIYVLHRPNPDMAKRFFSELPPNFPSGSVREAFEQVSSNLLAILAFENLEFKIFRTYIWMLFRFNSLVWAVDFLEKLVSNYAKIEFQANLGKAYLRSGRTKEARHVLLAVLKKGMDHPGMEKYFPQYIVDYLDALKLGGSNKEVLRNFEKYKHLLSSLRDFETRKDYWLGGQA